MYAFFSFIVAFDIYMFFHSAGCHPQCLDSSPPFNSTKSLGFCTQYSEFGCCTSIADDLIKEKYDTFNATISATDSLLWNKCSEYVKSLLCQKCSPFSAHIFDAENTGSQRDFPGLCFWYCHVMYKTCKVVFEHMYRNSSEMMTALAYHSEEFCTKVEPSDYDYCYPAIDKELKPKENFTNEQKTAEGCLCLERFQTELRNPIFARPAHDGSDRIFVGEQKGVVRVLYPDGKEELEYFLNMTEIVHTTERKGDERGLLGMAFHPNFKENSYFFLHYTAACVDNCQGYGLRNVISRMRVSASNPKKADVSTNMEILQIPQPYRNHNGGELFFGPDGYLYIFLGDGGSFGDPENRAQNLRSLIGKVLRIDVDNISPSVPYWVPRDNPFVSADGGIAPVIRAEIYAYGLRNPWRCGMDRGDPDTGEGYGRIFCGDVGQAEIEEIDIIKKGSNYGWNAYEGDLDYRPDEWIQGRVHERPIFNYTHDVGKSVTGGTVYRGCQNPSLNGFYFYADYFRGRLFRLLERAGRWENEEVFMCGDDVCNNGLVGQYPRYILAFGEDEGGELYMLATSTPSTESPEARMFKIVDPTSKVNSSKCRSWTGSKKNHAEEQTTADESGTHLFSTGEITTTQTAEPSTPSTSKEETPVYHSTSLRTHLQTSSDMYSSVFEVSSAEWSSTVNTTPADDTQPDTALSRQTILYAGIGAGVGAILIIIIVAAAVVVCTRKRKPFSYTVNPS